MDQEIEPSIIKAPQYDAQEDDDVQTVSGARACVLACGCVGLCMCMCFCIDIPGNIVQFVMLITLFSQKDICIHRSDLED